MYNDAKLEQFRRDFPGLFSEGGLFCVSYPDGWDEVLRSACRDFMVMKRDVLPDLEVTYVKQKYACIRIHTHSEMLRTMEGKEGDLRRDAIFEIEADAEYMSRHTCEECGAGFDALDVRPPVAWGVNIGGWERVLCEEHFISECKKRGVSILCPSERW